MSDRAFTVVLISAVLGCATGDLAWSQEVRATMGGRVTDMQGAVVPGATVTVVSDDTAVERRTHSNSQGNWIVQFLLPGHYRFSVAAPAFKTAVGGSVTLQAADNKELDVQLEVGAVTQSVEIKAEAPLTDVRHFRHGDLFGEYDGDADHLALELEIIRIDVIASAVGRKLRGADIRPRPHDVVVLILRHLVLRSALALHAAPDTNPASANFGVVQKSQQNHARAVQMLAKLSF